MHPNLMDGTLGHVQLQKSMKNCLYLFSVTFLWICGQTENTQKNSRASTLIFLPQSSKKAMAIFNLRWNSKSSYAAVAFYVHITDKICRDTVFQARPGHPSQVPKSLTKSTKSLKIISISQHVKHKRLSCRKQHKAK